MNLVKKLVSLVTTTAVWSAVNTVVSHHVSKRLNKASGQPKV